jgi:hypothetical protein
MAAALSAAGDRKMRDEELQALGTAEDIFALMSVLVNNCTCGCTYTGHALISRSADYAARRALRDRRFVLGMLFARHLRDQLQAQELTRTSRRTRSEPRSASKAAGN